jgi:hypothetical protein
LRNPSGEKIRLSLSSSGQQAREEVPLGADYISVLIKQGGFSLTKMRDFARIRCTESLTSSYLLVINFRISSTKTLKVAFRTIYNPGACGDL